MRIIIYILFLCVPVVGFGQEQQSAMITKDSCIFLIQRADSKIQAGAYQESQDLYMQFVESCTGTVKTYGAFSGMNVSNQLRNTDLNRYPEHREWLKKVLYYDLDTLYYCADVFSMLKTFQYFDSAHGRYIEGAMTVARYIKDSARCDNFDDNIEEALVEDMQELYEKWLDTVQDPNATPFNPQFPTLEDLDLTILRGNPNSAVNPTVSEERLGELIATRNPFTDILELKYRLDKSAMVRIDVYDLLGRAVYSEGQGYKAEGEHVLSLQSNAWSSGSYYVRLSSPSGEVKTVKVVKE